MLKRAGLALALAVIFTLSIGTVAMGDSEVINVPDDEDTIQDAIDAAEEGDTIEVAAGTYEEAVELNVRNVTLQSTDSAGDTIIKAEDDDVDEGTGVVGILAENVTLNGFTLDNKGSDDHRGIRVDGDATGAVIESNIFVEARRGIQGDLSGGANELTIGDNTFEDTIEHGIAGTEDMENLLIEDNTFETSVEGIGIGPGSTLNTDIDDLFYQNYFEIVDGFAIGDYRDDPVTKYIAADTLLVEEGDSIQDAIDAADEGDTIEVAAGEYDENLDVDIEDLTLEGPNVGIHGTGDREAEAVIDGSVDVGANEDGISIDGFTIEGKTHLRGEDTGFVNNVVDSPGDGIVTGSAAPVRDNSFDIGHNAVKATGHALQLDGDTETSAVAVIGNTIHDSGRGIQTFGSLHHSDLDFTIEDNVVMDNDAGIRLAAGWVTVENNTIENNNEYGINAGADDLSLAGLEITDNDIEGHETGLIIGAGEDADDVVIGGEDVENTFENNDLQVWDKTDDIDLDEVIENNEFDRIVVRRGSAVVGGKIYSTLSQAADEAEDGETIEIVDVDEDDVEATFDPDEIIPGDDETVWANVEFGKQFDQVGEKFAGIRVEVDFEADELNYEDYCFEDLDANDNEVVVETKNEEDGEITLAYMLKADDEVEDTFAIEDDDEVRIEFSTVADLFNDHKAEVVITLEEIIIEDNADIITLDPIELDATLDFKEGNVIEGAASFERSREDERKIDVELDAYLEEVGEFGDTTDEAVEEEFEFKFEDVYPGDGYDVRVNADGYLEVIIQDVEVYYDLDEATDLDNLEADEEIILYAGDITGDGHVTVIDLWRIAQKFGEDVEDEAIEDLTGDGEVGLVDLRMVARNMGKTTLILTYEGE